MQQSQARIGRLNHRKIDSNSSLSFRRTLLSYPYVLPHGRIYKAQGAPLQNDRFPLYTTLPSTSTLHDRELPCNPLHKASSPGRRVLRISKRPEPVNIVYCLSCIWHEPFCYSRRHRPTPKNTSRGNPGCAVGPKTPTAGAPGRGVCNTRVLGVQSPGVNIITRCAGTKSHTYDESWHRIECHIFTI
jgi:hypothetical protein